MKNLVLLASMCCLMFSNVLSQNIQIELVEVANGFINPVDIVHVNDSRLFIVEKAGKIRILNSSGTISQTAFLDITNLVVSGGERGLLGLAFHPDYENNGYFYVHYTNLSGDSRVVRYTRGTLSPNIADPNSAFPILSQSQPYSNHNAGDINFGPDGYLYIPYGDGGSGGDPEGYGQNTNTQLGKMLRIDVDGGTPYSIPNSNPFIGDDGVLDQIWAIGLRNPWRFSFDVATGDMWIGDVGQNVWEEIDFEPAGSAGGINYGWRCKEGFVNFNTSGCSGLVLEDPVAVYNHTGGACSVTGGYVYRGSDFPGMFGKYIFTDYCNGVFRALSPDGLGGWDHSIVSSALGFGWTSFGEDFENELYVANSQGIIYRVEDTSTPAEVNVQLKVLLDGSYVPGTSLMNDQLREDDKLPLTEPYSSLGFNHIIGGGENSSPSLFAVTGDDAIVDWVFVELRSGADPSSILATQSALLQRDGDVVSSSGVSSLAFSVSTASPSVYVAIRHRNHFGIRTENAYSITTPVVVDFSDLSTNIYGVDPTNVVDGKNCLIPGDANYDGQVNTIDKNSYWRLQNAVSYDYNISSADFNLDGVVNTVDKNNYWRTNNSKVQQLD